MTDPLGDPAFEKQVRDEFSRIGIKGFNLDNQFPREQLLKALRMTPDGVGPRAFVAILTELIGGGSAQ